MRRILRYMALAAVAGLFFISCTPTEKEFDRNLMVGRWVSTQYFAGDSEPHTVYDVFNSDGTGKSWDVTDDVTEEEAQKFKWTLQGSTLSIAHYLETTGEYGVPKTYTVTELTQSRLVYKDYTGKTITSTRVN